jgi:CelD/BcsL family acetyltransferase involved in cellulose biosynthesis
MPLIVTAFNSSGRPVALLPLGHAVGGPLRTLRFLGGKHSNTNFGVFDREFAAAAGPADIRFIVGRIAAGVPDVDLIALHRQPTIWEGFANPLLHLRHQPSPSDCCQRDLRCPPDHEIARVMRKKLRSKTRRLAELPGYRYFQAATPQEAKRLLDWFFPVKAKRLDTQGAANVFAEPGVEEFVRNICDPGLTGEPLTELHAIEWDGGPLAVFGGIGNGRRFSSMFNAYTLGPQARHSPGLVLLNLMIANLRERGFAAFDLGAGDATYKRTFCRETEPLFDSFLPLPPRGQVAAAGWRVITAFKRGIKNTPQMWSALRFVRRHLNRTPKAPPASSDR